MLSFSLLANVSDRIKKRTNSVRHYKSVSQKLNTCQVPGIGNLRSVANWNVMAAFVVHIPVDNVSIEQCAPVQFCFSAIGNMNVKLFCLFFSLSYFSVNDLRWSCTILCKHIGKDYRVFGHHLYSFSFPLVVMFIILLVPFFFFFLLYPFFVVTNIARHIAKTECK